MKQRLPSLPSIATIARPQLMSKLLTPLMLAFLSTTALALPVQAAEQASQTQPANSVEADLALWKELTQKDSSDLYDFSTYASFISRHPDWPSQKTLRLNAEKSLNSGIVGSGLLKGFFSTTPPQTPEGLAVYVAELAGEGQSANVPKAIKAFWRTADMTSAEQRTFASRWAHYLTAEDTTARAQNLIWQDSLSLAKALLPLLPPDEVKLIQARITLRETPSAASAALNAVPAHLMDDSGLTYDRLRWRIKADLEPDAIDLLLRTASAPEGHAADWWKQRDYLLHYALKEGSKEKAYAIASHHNFKPDDGVPYAEAEWASGWVALRFLNNPSLAVSHFVNMDKAAKSMVLKAKAAYWMGRAATALSQIDTAKKWYEHAAKNSITFYGQLAAIEAYGAVNMSVPATPQPDTSFFAAFHRKSLVRAIRILSASGERELSDRFFKALAESVKSQEEASACILLGNELGRPDYAVLAGKTAGRLGYLVGAEAYPVLKNAPRSPSPAFVHAIMRQESMLNPRALSPVGAMGLMQLMPSTAKIEAGKIGVPYEQSKLYEPNYNATLGSSYLSRLLERFDGSEVYATAAYNAGPNRIDQWRDDYGDPQTVNTSHTLWKTIDWIELIPFNETRSYVMRVMEAVSIYEARISPSGKVPLSLQKNLMP